MRTARSKKDRIECVKTIAVIEQLIKNEVEKIYLTVRMYRVHRARALCRDLQKRS